MARARRPQSICICAGAFSHQELEVDRHYAGSNFRLPASVSAPHINEVGACGVTDEELPVRSKIVVTPAHHGHPAQAVASSH